MEKLFFDKIPELSGIRPNGTSEYTLSVIIECSENARGQVTVKAGERSLNSVGFECTNGIKGHVSLNGVWDFEGIPLDTVVECQQNVVATGRLHINSQGGPSLQFCQDEPVLIGKDTSLCEVPGCKIAAISGRILCSMHAFPGEKVKSDRRRAIEATKAKKEAAQVLKEGNR